MRLLCLLGFHKTDKRYLDNGEIIRTCKRCAKKEYLHLLKAGTGLHTFVWLDEKTSRRIG